MTEIKPCKVCNFTRQKSYGLVVPSLDELRIKGEFVYCFIGRLMLTLDDSGRIRRFEGLNVYYVQSSLANTYTVGYYVFAPLNCMLLLSKQQHTLYI